MTPAALAAARRGGTARVKTPFNTGLWLKIAAGVVGVLIVALAGFGWHYWQVNKQYRLPDQPDEAVAAVKAYYLQHLPAAERQAYEQLHELLAKTVPEDQRTIYLHNVVQALTNFVQKYPDSLFSRVADQVDYGRLLPVPKLVARSVREARHDKARTLAGEMPAALEKYQEELIRRLRAERHAQEIVEVVNPEHERLKARGKVEATIAEYKDILAKRKKKLEDEARAAAAQVKRRGDVLAKEKDAVRDAVMHLTRDYAFAEAAEELRKREAARAGYPEPIAPVVDALVAKKDEDEELRRLVDDVGGKKDQGVSPAEVRQVLRDLLVGAGLSEAYKQLADTKKEEVALLAQRQEWFGQERAALELAVKFYGLVSDTKAKFAGRPLKPAPFPVAPDARAEIALILSTTLQAELKKYNIGTGKFELQETKTIPLRELPLSLFMELAKASWGELNPVDFELHRGAYLFFVGKLLSVKEALDKVNEPRSAFLLAELKLVEPRWREEVIVEGIARIKTLMTEKKPADAKKHADNLKTAFGESAEYKRHEADIAKALSGN